MRSSCVLLLLLSAFALFAFVTCNSDSVTFVYSALLVDDNHQCTTILDNECVPCVNGNVTTSFRCITHGSNDPYCHVYSDSQCQHETSRRELELSTCNNADTCTPVIHIDSVLQMTATADSPIIVSVGEGIISELYLSATKIVATVMADYLSLTSSSSEVEFEIFFDDDGFLTSAGPCAIGQVCEGGDITYSADVVAPITAYKPFSLQLELWSSRVAVQSVSSDPIQVNSIVDVLTTSLDTVGDLVFFVIDDYETAISDIVFEDLDTDTPVMTYNTYVDGEPAGYQYTDCTLIDFQLLGTNHTTISCRLDHILNSLEYGGSFGSFGSFSYISPIGWYWDDEVMDRVSSLSSMSDMWQTVVQSFGLVNNFRL